MRCSVRSSEAIYIGDEIHDAEATTKAGIAFGTVTWGQHNTDVLRLHNPAHIFRTVQEIAEKLG